ncbi:MAG: chaperone modulator CbpM [Gammaproteobacteria bacterium]|nr:chaperone modulator CbpM [Gammaproteobacteria bacterium]
MSRDLRSLLSGDVLEEEVELTFIELCRACRLPAERVVELVQEGVVEPQGRDPEHWRFRGASLARVRCALRLQRDLGVNTAGAALALELLEELEFLRLRLERFRE